MRWFVVLVCATLLYPVSGFALNEGLAMRYLVDRDRDGVLETQVCGDQPIPTAQDPHVSETRIGLAFRYPQDVTPCESIGPGDRWGIEFTGLAKFTTPRVTMVPFDTDVVADVNDGLRFSLRDPDTGEDVCRIDFWRDVPEYDNYQSTDGNGIWNVCSEFLVVNRLYEVSITVYHESDVSIRHYLFNRAYLDLWFTGIRRRNIALEFFHHTEPPPPLVTVEGLRMNHRARQDKLKITLKAWLSAPENLDLEAYRETVIQCLEQ